MCMCLFKMVLPMLSYELYPLTLHLANFISVSVILGHPEKLSHDNPFIIDLDECLLLDTWIIFFVLQ